MTGYISLNYSLVYYGTHFEHTLMSIVDSKRFEFTLNAPCCFALCSKIWWFGLNCTVSLDCNSQIDFMCKLVEFFIHCTQSAAVLAWVKENWEQKANIESFNFTSPGVFVRSEGLKPVALPVSVGWKWEEGGMERWDRKDRVTALCLGQSRRLEVVGRERERESGRGFL